jgi:uncharacterized protein YheU (UPF0270 family)
MEIPHQQLSPEALQTLVEEFVSRDGTDYGNVEISLEEKTTQVIKQLDKGDVVIVFDAATDSCTIVSQHDLKHGINDATNRL